MAHRGGATFVHKADVFAPHEADLQTRVGKVAQVAARHASNVDVEARFPHEAVAALRDGRLLGILVPDELGGEGARISDVVEICYGLGRACSATAMIYAMHQAMAACLLHHGRGNLWQERMLRRLSSEQLLLASSTTEGKRGGDLRSSETAVEYRGAAIRLERLASCISYAEHADAILTTARRSADAAPSQQVLLVLPKETYVLERQITWDTLGMRGTCSTGFKLTVEGTVEQILPDPYGQINAHTMMPVAHLAWSGAWAGIAAEALERARLFTLRSMRSSGGKTPPGAAHLTLGSRLLGTLRNRIEAAARRYEEVSRDPRLLDSIEFQTTMSLLKVDASELALSIAMAAMRACGLSGYRNDTEFSVARHVRDLLSSPLMISNDRILANRESHVLLSETPGTIGQPA